MHYPIDFEARNRNNFGVALCGKVDAWFGDDWAMFLKFWERAAVTRCWDCDGMVRS